MLSTSLRRTALATLVAAAALVGALALPAGAEEPDIPYFTEVTGSAVAVSGTYTPVVGHFTDASFDDIIWYAPGSGTDRQWTPCPGCESGQFTKDVLDPQVNGEYSAIVGNFSGDSLDDIFWWSGLGKDYLWTNNGSGAFTSRPLNMAVGEWEPIVITDSQSGDGRDDILWRSFRRTSPLWVFPDNGSGAARTVARLDAPLGMPVVGDFDANGAADVFFYRAKSGCTCPEPGPAAMIDTYWRRSSSEAPVFTETTQNVKGEYLPVAGHFSGGGGDRADIFWLGAINQSRSGLFDGPDSLWEGRASGQFAASSQSIPTTGWPVVLGHDGADTVFIDGYDTVVWFDTTSGPVLRPVGEQVGRWGTRLVGRFTSPDRDDIFLYRSGTQAEVLYHPIY
jgi:hypothetical protein